MVTKTFPLKLGNCLPIMIFFFQHFICKKPVRLFFLLSNNFANSERIPIKIMREGPKSQKNHCDRKKKPRRSQFDICALSSNLKHRLLLKVGLF